MSCFEWDAPMLELDGRKCVMWCPITCREACVDGDELCAAVRTQQRAHDGRNKVRSLPRRRIFYFIAYFRLSIPSSGISLFLPLSLHFSDCNYGRLVRHPSDGVNTCCPASIAPTSQPSLSHLAFPNNRRILPQVHPLKRTTSRPRRLQTRQVPPFSVYATLQYFYF